MKFVSWFILGALLWFALPILVPIGICYVIIRILNVAVIGKSVEEVHNEH